jgi:hypothetical protein
MFFGPAANSLFASGRCSNMRRRMRERGFDTVAADRAASDQRNGDPVERLGDARQSISVYGSSEKQFGQLSYLERERSRGRRSADRSDHDWRCLYGAGDLPIGQPDDNGDQPRGRQQIRIGNCHRAERRFLSGCPPGVARGRCPSNLALHTRSWPLCSGAHPDKSKLWSLSGASCRADQWMPAATTQHGLQAFGGIRNSGVKTIADSSDRRKTFVRHDRLG